MAHVIDIALPLAKPSGSQISPLRSPPSPDHTIADAPESLHNPEIDAKQDSRPLSLFFRILRDHSTPLDHALRAIGIIAAISSGVAPPLMTLVFGSSVDKFNSFGSEEASSQLYDDLSRNALWFLYLFIARFVLVYTYATCFGVTGIRAIRKFRQAFTKSLIRQDVGYLDSQSAGSTTMTISNNADLVENGITEKIGTLLQAISMFVAAFVVAFTQQWALTLVTATTLPVLFAGFYVTFSLDAKIEAKILDIYNTAGGLVEEALGTIGIATAFNARPKLTQKYDTYLAEAQQIGFKKGPVIGVQWSVEFFSTFCAYSLAWFYGVKLLNQGKIDSGGDIIAVLLAVLLGTQAASDVAPGFGDFTKASAAAKSMFDIIDRPSQIDSLGTSGDLPLEGERSVHFENVTFAYPSRPSINVLQDLSFTADAGKVTALVGHSGSGKSTIVGLIERWFDTASGCVRIGNHMVTDVNVRWLRQQVGLVQQEPFLFSDTIYRNVVHGLYGTPLDLLPEPEKRQLVQEACVQAFADEFIRRLPDGYDTLVGDRGSLLSGGQRQRVAIARTVISNPRILLLDEATSALDPTAERKVQAALNNVTKSRTTIVIAHKLSTIQSADKIVVLNQGTFVEQGTHQELLAQQGVYYKLTNAQVLGPSQEVSKQAVSERFDIVKPVGSIEKAEPYIPTSPGDDSASFLSGEIKSNASDSDEDPDNNITRRYSLVHCLAVMIFKDQRLIWTLFLAGTIASLAGGGLFPAQAVLFGESIPTLQIPPSEHLVRRGNFWALMYFVLALGVLLAYLGVGFFWTIAAFHATRFYRREYFDSMLRQDVCYFDIKGHSPAEMTSRLSTNPQRLQNLLSTNLALILVVIVNLTSCCILALVVGWQLGLVVIASGIPVLFGSGFFRMRLEMTNQDRVSRMYLESARFVSEAIGSIRTVSSLTLENKILNGYSTLLAVSSRAEMKTKMLSMLMFAFSESASLGVSGLAFWYGGKLMYEGKYNVTEFFIVFIAVVYGAHAAGYLFGFTSDMTKAHAAANHIIHLRRSQPAIGSSKGVSSCLTSEKELSIIQFDNVCFSYPTRPDVPVLRNLNMRIDRGQSIGLVGASGCGKSTIVALLERFYDIESGKLLIEGLPLRDLDIQQHRSRMGLVSQDTTLYQGSIYDNVLLGLEEASFGKRDASLDDLVIRTCKAANIHDFIISLPQGYETSIGSRGISLSGGQRQRLAIARALVRDPEILLLDEATSALDTENEALVQAAIESISQSTSSRTLIAVAHRLSTIKRCDRIFVLHDGQVDEAGTHDALLARRGRYYEMVLAQALDRELDE